MCSRSLMTHDMRLMGQKDVISVGDFPALSNGMIVATRYLGSEQVKKMNWIWIVIPGGPKDQVTWKMKVGCCQGQLLLYFSSFWWEIVIHPFKVEHSFHCQHMVCWCHDWNVTYWVCWPWHNGLYTMPTWRLWSLLYTNLVLDTTAWSSSQKTTFYTRRLQINFFQTFLRLHLF